MSVPKKMLYTKEHEWVLVDGSLVTVGITDYAQSELGDIVFVELPEVGDETTQNESFGTIEAVKAVSELFAPVSGKVVEVNKNLDDAPELVNSNPYDDGWMIKIELTNASELDGLLVPADYEAMISE